jgi:hypothetical protein
MRVKPGLLAAAAIAVAPGSPIALSPYDVDNVRMFVWKTSIEAKGERPGG